MYLIKLNAISSTNDYLKQLVSSQITENYTVVITENQTNGKGQMGSSWDSEVGKNLTFSVLVKNVLVKSNQIFSLNVAVSTAIIFALKKFNIPNLSVKWPNDIMSGNSKLCGILIENIFKSDGEIYSIIGIGLNVNQIEFDDLIKATSLKILTNTEYKLNDLLIEIVYQIKLKVAKILNGYENDIWKYYHDNLFKKETPMAFEDKNNRRFMGIIKRVSLDGKLEIVLENNSINSYFIKEIKMLY